MRELETMVDMLVASARAKLVSIGTIRAQLIQDGMDEEEISLLIDIVALEMRHNPTSQ